MRSLVFGLAAMSAGTLTVAPCSAAPAPDSVRLELQSAAAAMDAAWDRKDLTSFADLFHKDATIQAGPTAVIDGQAAIRSFFGRDFENRRGTMRHVSETIRTDMIGSDLALVDKRVRLEQRSNEGHWTALRTFVNSTVLMREQGVWKVRTVRAYVVPNS